MRPTPQLSVKTWGGGSWGGGGGGGRREGGGGGGGDWQLSRGEGLRATHYYHMHTSRVCVCVWGHGGIEVRMR